MWKGESLYSGATLTRMTHSSVRYSALCNSISLAQIWGCSRAILPVTYWVVSMQFMEIILLDINILHQGLRIDLIG